MALDGQPLAMVLFSLRYVQEHLNPEDFEGAEHFIGEDFGPMDDEEIDDLCESLNCEDELKPLAEIVGKYQEWVKENSDENGDIKDDCKTEEARADWDRDIADVAAGLVTPAEPREPFDEDVCPNCKSSNITAEDFDLEGSFRPHECQDCEATWKVVYYPQDAYEVKVPDGKT